MNKQIHQISKVREEAEGIEIEGKIYLILKRNGVRTEICPFCGERHKHGHSDGHRVPHCTRDNYIFGRKAIFQNKHGQIFNGADGYYIQTVNETKIGRKLGWYS